MDWQMAWSELAGWQAGLIVAAAAAAGAVNVLVGGGSLITYPTLLALGLPPVLANVSNNVGLIPGNVAGVLAYRPLLTGQGRPLRRLLAASLLGGLSGAILLLALPARVFGALVPLLVALASVLMALQPQLKAWIERSRGPQAGGSRLLLGGVYLSGVYGGYFGAAQGILLLALLGLGLGGSLQRLNAYKNLLAVVVNGTAALYFIATTRVDWGVVALIALGTSLGGWSAGRLGQRIPEERLRWGIVATGLVVALLLAWRLR
jgi:uncharacterized membrane protein YfcA